MNFIRQGRRIHKAAMPKRGPRNGRTQAKRGIFRVSQEKEQESEVRCLLGSISHYP